MASRLYVSLLWSTALLSLYLFSAFLFLLGFNSFLM